MQRISTISSKLKSLDDNTKVFWANKGLLYIIYFGLAVETIVNAYAPSTLFRLEYCPFYFPALYSFLTVSGVLVLIGSKVPSCLVACSTTFLLLMGNIMALTKMCYYFSFFRAISEILTYTAFTFITLSMLSSQAKVCLSRWRYFFLNLTLLTSLTAFLLQVSNRFEYWHFLELLPLELLSLTALLIAGLKNTYLGGTINKIDNIGLSISCLLGSLIGLLTTRADQYIFGDDDDFEEYAPLSDVVEKFPIMNLWPKENVASVVSVMLCVSCIYIFNLLSAWAARPQGDDEDDSKRSEKGISGTCIPRSSARKGSLLWILYISTLIYMLAYLSVHMYVCYLESCAQHLHKEYVFYSDQGDLQHISEISEKVGRVVSVQLMIGDASILVVIIGDWLLFYFIYILNAVKKKISWSLIVIPIFVLTLSSYAAATRSGSTLSDGASAFAINILAHTALIYTLLIGLSPHTKFELSRWRNHFLFLSQLFGQLFLFSSVRSNNIYIFLMLLVLIATEYFSVVLVTSCVRKGIRLRKMSITSATKILCAYNILWLMISVSIDFTENKIPSSPEYRFIRVQPSRVFWNASARSIVYHVSSMFIYTILTIWYYDKLEQNV